MIFNSYLFLLVFLPLFLLGTFFLQRQNNRFWMLLFVVGMSSLFYAYSSIGYLVLFWVSIILNWLWVMYTPLNRIHLAIGIIGNLAILFFYKYADFITSELYRFGVLKGQYVTHLSYALPLAISFYTFHQNSFLIDSYRDKDKNTEKPDFLTYATYITFFPQLVAGPIVRYREIANRLKRPMPLKITLPRLKIGTVFVVLGLIKKLLVADTIAEFADYGFAMTGSLTLFEAWVAVISFGLQIYFDFSAYSDIAYGLACMVGIKLPLNFNRPYIATDVSAFWRRWHMTLSRFLRDYLYIPLGGNRNGIIKTGRNLLIVMGLGGFWHGANWNFLLWGFLHGFYLAVNHIWKLISPFRLPKIIGWFITFFAVMLAWVPFRAKTFMETKQVYSALFNFKSIVLPENLFAITHHLGIDHFFIFRTSSVLSMFSIMSTLAFLIFTVSAPSVRMISSIAARSKYGALILGSLLSIVLVMLWDRPNVFIYFNF